LPSEHCRARRRIDDLDEAIRACEIAIILGDHDQFKMIPLAERRHLAVIDTRGVWQTCWAKDRRGVIPLHRTQGKHNNSPPKWNVA